jgi:AcrR family transcriptional regulator
MGSSPSTGGATNTSAPPDGAQGKRVIRGLDADQRRAHRRDQLLTAAFDLIARDGYANTSIEQICQTAYVGTKAFYEAFDSKEDCYLELLRQVAQRTEALAVEALEHAPALDDDGLEHLLVSVFVHTLVDDPRVAVIAFGECAGISPRVERVRRENRNWTASFIEDLWRGGSWLPSTGAFDYHALAISTVGGLFEGVADWLNPPDGGPRASVDALIASLTQFVAVVRRGIAASAADNTAASAADAR